MSDDEMRAMVNCDFMNCAADLLNRFGVHQYKADKSRITKSKWNIWARFSNETLNVNDHRALSSNRIKERQLDRWIFFIYLSYYTYIFAAECAVHYKTTLWREMSKLRFMDLLHVTHEVQVIHYKDYFTTVPLLFSVTPEKPFIVQKVSTVDGKV